jgi:predicted acyl esterase
MSWAPYNGDEHHQVTAVSLEGDQMRSSKTLRSALKMYFIVVLLTLLLILLPTGLATASAENDPGIEITEVWLDMPDGIRLAADLYKLKSASPGDRFPVILEYIPYRKDESRSRNYALYSYFVERGYIVARVDIRGTGRSQGRTIPYEYSDIELDDGEKVIDWLSRQDWSTGKVGIFGISWGGFNSIQLAMRNPPALKAFIALMATEELYQEDVHYMDGIIHTDSWMMSNDLYNAMPGAPDFIIDDKWVEQRFNVEPSVYTYMRQQRDGPFWDRASARGRYETIKIPGFHIGGWYDGYRNSLPRMLENVSAPVKAMIGPWDHYFPNTAWPEPQVEWRHEAVRFWDHWLKGIDTGIMAEPAFAVFMRSWHAPDPTLTTVPGYWRWQKGWPVKEGHQKTLYAHEDHGLMTVADDLASHSMKYKASVGLEGGGPVMWWGGVIHDQQPMDNESLVYETEPLEAPLEILGFPRTVLNVSSDATRANWVARISDVSPQGQVTQVSGAGFNATHRESSREPRDLVPGEAFDLDVEMQFTSWVFPKGHRIRLAVSNSQWPMFWPTPYPMTTQLNLGTNEGTRVMLPVVPASNLPVPQFLKPAPDPVLAGYETLDSGNITGYGEIDKVEVDPNTGETFGTATNSGSTRYPWGVEHFKERIEHRTSDENPANTSVKGIYSITQELEDRVLRFEQEVLFSSDVNSFRLIFKRWLKVNGNVVHEKQWDETIPRDFQ